MPKCPFDKVKKQKCARLLCDDNYDGDNDYDETDNHDGDGNYNDDHGVSLANKSRLIRILIIYNFLIGAKILFGKPIMSSTDFDDNKDNDDDEGDQ